MRRGTRIAIIALFLLIGAAAIAQYRIAAEDRPPCPGPVASPNATPPPGTSLTCR